MSTKLLAVWLTVLCLLGGCDDGASSQARSSKGNPPGQAVQASSEVLSDTRGFSENNDRASHLSLEDALKEIRYLHAIEGSAVGYSGVKGEFFVLSEIIVRDGNGEIFADFLDDNKPVVRAMGLLCFSQTDRVAAVQVLKDHLGDRETVLCGPGGCIYSNTSVGGFACELLKDANHLGHGEPMPLLPADELQRLDLEILMDDAATSAHSQAGFSIGDAVEAGELWLDRESLERLSDEPFFRIIKALGRVRHRSTRQVEQFLAQQLADNELDANCRLAAASALTRYPTDESEEALKKHEAALNRLSNKALGSRFLATLEEHRRHAERIVELRKQDWRYRRRDEHAFVLEVCQCRHPFAMDDIVAERKRADPDVDQAVAEYLIDMAKDVAKYQAPWDTYSNVAFVLDVACQPPFAELLHSNREIPDTTRETVGQAIAPFIESQR